MKAGAELLGGGMWAIEPEALACLSSLMEAYTAGRLSDEAVRAALPGGGQRAASAGLSGIAYIPIYGPLTGRFGWGTSPEMIGRAVDEAAAEPSVKSILLDVASPGGSVYGIAELADTVFRARRRKPVVAQVTQMAASAAYHVASQASEIVLSPSGEVGSIGVFMMHMDMSRMLQSEGLKPTFIFAGKHKVEGNPFEPLSADARENQQQHVDRIYADFVSDVARGRGVSVGTVRVDFGKGRLVNAKEALRLRMVDRLGTLSETIGRMVTSQPRRASGAGALASERQRRLDELRLDPCEQAQMARSADARKRKLRLRTLA